MTLVTAGSSLLGADKIHQVSQVCFSLTIGVLFPTRIPRLAKRHIAAIRNIGSFSSSHSTVIFILVTLGPQNGCHGSRPHVCIPDRKKEKKELKVKGQRRKSKMVKRPIL